MKAMPLPFDEFQGKGLFPLHHFSDSPLSAVVLSSSHPNNNYNCYVGREPTSVLDSRRSPSPPTSSSLNAAMDDWESVLAESSPHNSILRLIMDDPDFGLLDSLDPPNPHQIGMGFQQQAQLVPPPPAKRINTGGHFSSYSYAQHQPQAIADQLSKAAELIETGTNPELAQGILARLNHQLTPAYNNSPPPPPLQRASIYFKDALQCLLGGSAPSASLTSSPFGFILRIGAHKAFSEVSPLLQFANFTSNQAILDATHGFPRIHVVDFDIGYGGQWASLMQEVAMRSPAVSLKITAFASHHDFEIAFTHDNLTHFAADLGLAFHLDILSLDALASAPVPAPAEAVAVNLPVAAPLLPLALRFAKQLAPKVLVALERPGDRPDAPFPAQVAHGLGAYAALLESLDAVNAAPDAAQKIERCLVQPAIERLVLAGGRRERPVPPWRTLLAGAGFAPISFSNFAESQAECLVQRTPAHGFHVDKRHASLVLCWHRKDLVSVSAWRC